jgi:Flp pilus assembly protein TadG
MTRPRRDTSAGRLAVRLHSEDGTIVGFVAVLALALIAVAGLAFDGGQIVTTTARARDLAGAAARTGAQQIEAAELHAGRAHLDPAAAHAAATGFLTAAGVEGIVTVDDTQVTVTVTATQPMRLLPLPARTITVTGRAATISDVVEAGP